MEVNPATEKADDCLFKILAILVDALSVSSVSFILGSMYRLVISIDKFLCFIYADITFDMPYSSVF